MSLISLFRSWHLKLTASSFQRHSKKFSHLLVCIRSKFGYLGIDASKTNLNARLALKNRSNHHYNHLTNLKLSTNDDRLINVWLNHWFNLWWRNQKPEPVLKTHKYGKGYIDITFNIEAKKYYELSLWCEFMKVL